MSVKMLALKTDSVQSAIIWGPCKDVVRANLLKAVSQVLHKPYGLFVLTPVNCNAPEGRWQKLICSRAYRAEVLPVEDFRASPIINMTQAVAGIVRTVMSGGIAVVCCRGGIGRSGTAVLGALELLTGRYWKELREEVAEKVVLFDENFRSFRKPENRDSVLSEIGPEESLEQNELVVCPEFDEDCKSEQYQFLDSLYILRKLFG